MADITVPRNDSLIETDENSPTRKEPFIVSRAWIQMLFDPLTVLLASLVKIVKTTSLTTPPLSASIATASAYLTTAPGLFRVSYIMRVSRPATTSSALQITIGWVRSGIAQTKVGASLVGNVLTTYETDSFLVHADGLTDLTYAVTYGSVGATPLQYELDVVVERLG